MSNVTTLPLREKESILYTTFNGEPIGVKSKDNDLAIERHIDSWVARTNDEQLEFTSTESLQQFLVAVLCFTGYDFDK